MSRPQYNRCRVKIKWDTRPWHMKEQEWGTRWYGTTLFNTVYLAFDANTNGPVFGTPQRVAHELVHIWQRQKWPRLIRWCWEIAYLIRGIGKGYDKHPDEVEAHRLQYHEFFVAWADDEIARRKEHLLMKELMGR